MEPMVEDGNTVVPWPDVSAKQIRMWAVDVAAVWQSHQSEREARNADALAAELTERAAMWGMV